MKEIRLTRGFVAIVDDDDYSRVSAYRWRASVDARTVYAKRTSSRRSGLQTIYMHRAILGDVCDGLEVDHINLNGLDNRRANLRLATRTQNKRNCAPYRKNSLAMKGVRWNGKWWVAQISIQGRTKYLGRCATPSEAYRAYCAAAVPLHGEYAQL